MFSSAASALRCVAKFSVVMTKFSVPMFSAACNRPFWAAFLR